MRYILFDETVKKIRQIYENHKKVIVAFSGGKDSWCVLDLCAKHFDEVKAFHMYLVPGLSFVEEQLDAASRRYGVEILQYPHWLLFRLLKEEVYCDSHWKLQEALPDFRVNDISMAVMADTGIRLVAHGAKESDSMWRRRYFTINKLKNYFYPLRNWAKYDVLNYLRLNNIETPKSSGTNAGGVDLSSKSLLFMHKHYPDDFRKLCAVFPYAEAVIWREKFYGAKQDR